MAEAAPVVGNSQQCELVIHVILHTWLLKELVNIIKHELNQHIKDIEWFDYISPIAGKLISVLIDRRLIPLVGGIPGIMILGPAAFEAGEALRRNYGDGAEVECEIVEPFKLKYYVMLFNDDVYATLTPFILKPL